MGVTIPGPSGEVKENYEISNSLRFNDDDSAYLSKTFASAGNRKLWTWSGWFKRTRLTGVVDSVFAGFTDINNRLRLNFLSDAIEIFGKIGGTTVQVVTSQVFRDVSAWYHIVWVMDSAQSTASNRMKLYINGEQVTDFSTTTYPAQNSESVVNNNTGHYIGQRGDGASLLDGYLTEINFVDGAEKAPTDFGRFNENNVWIPKRYIGTYGTNGFFLEFKQTGTSANSSGIGADTSGNDHHFTPTNLAATDVTEDTCTNNFATLNSLIASYASITYSEGNLALSASSTWTATIATFGASSGKWYWEYKMGASTTMIGVSDVDRNINVQYNHQQTGTVFYYNNDGNKYVDGSASSYGATYTTNDIIGVSLDLDSGTPTVTFYKNNVSQGTINLPSSMIGKTIVPIFEIQNNIKYVNFGNPPFSISSGNTDENGYGNFEYAPPSGYYALCTKNLAEFG